MDAEEARTIGLALDGIEADQPGGLVVPGSVLRDGVARFLQAGGFGHALLSLATRRGIVADGQAEAITRICSWLDAWRQEHDTGPWWRPLRVAALPIAARIRLVPVLPPGLWWRSVARRG